MRYFRVLLIVLSVVLCGASVATAQMSDKDVVEYAKKARAEGKSPEEIAVGLTERGVSGAQIKRIKDDIEGGGGSKSSGTPISLKNRERTGTTETAVGELSVGNIERAADRSGTIFGHDLFNNSRLSFEPNLNIPTPENYKLSAGDEVVIDIWGDAEKSIRQKISPEGSIVVEGIGPLYLNGLTIKEANARVKYTFGRIHSDLTADHPNTYINLSLGQIRSIRVNVIGEAAMPGTFTLSSLATVFHALYAAGGVNSVGTLRDIKVLRNGKILATVDVYHYLMTGDDSADVTLQDGDNIIIGTFQKLIKVEGAVKRPMYYEVVKDETLARLFEYAGGYKGTAYRKNIKLTRKTETEYKVYTVNDGDLEQFELVDGDRVVVGAILERYENMVRVRGAVFRPGEYALSENLTSLKQLLEIAEGVTGDAFMDRALLYRENLDLSTRVESIDLGALIRGEISDVKLQRNDQLYVPSIYGISETQTIRVHGDVKNPGVYSFIEDMSVEDVVIQAGGLLESASVIRVEISRRIRDNKSVIDSEVEAKIIQLELKDGLSIDGLKGFVLEPFDEVFIRRSPGYVEQQNVLVQGEVMFEGRYSKVQNNERISSLVKRAGGLTAKAYVRGARIERTMNEDERRRVETVLRIVNTGEDGDSLSRAMLDMFGSYYVGIELDKALKYPGSDYDLVLRENDKLIIPVYSNTVKISGAVMFPNTVTYNSKKSLKNYISQAGGYGIRAKSARTYIVYMNGTVARKKGWGNKRQFEPGCEIIVPLKPVRKGMSLPEIMSLTSSTTSIAALVTSIVNMTK